MKSDLETTNVRYLQVLRHFTGHVHNVLRHEWGIHEDRVSFNTVTGKLRVRIIKLTAIYHENDISARKLTPSLATNSIHYRGFARISLPRP